jgi:hypothetical protein
MGGVLLMVPAGTNADGTNTVLDDNIRFFNGANQVDAATKRRYIAWRGFPNESGQNVDDNNNLINLGDADGDIRPSPVLMPSPIGDRTRLRSIWIDTGSSVRRALQSADGAPRGIVEDATNNLRSGPTYNFAGTNLTPDAPPIGYRGWLDYEGDGQGGVRLKSPPAVVTTPVTSMSATATFEGSPAYSVELASASLGTIPNQYAHYQCALLNVSGSTVAEFRILGHSDRRLFLSPESGQLPQIPAGGLRASVLPKFFEVATDGVGLGASRDMNGHQVPYANVRIGFAFHTDPANPQYNANRTEDAKRWPVRLNEWIFDINSSTAREELRQKHMPYVMWDVLFNSRFSENMASDNVDISVPLNPQSPRQELRFLRIPYRF